MNSFIDGPLTADTGFLLREVGGLLGIEAKRVEYIRKREVFSDAMSYRLKHRLKTHVMVRAWGIPLIAFSLKYEEKMSFSLRHSLFAEMGGYLRDHWDELCSDPSAAKSFVYENGSVLIAPGEEIEAVLTDAIRFHAAMNKFTSDPDVQDDKAIFRGTEINAYEVAKLVKESGLAATLEAYPMLKRDDVEAALLYATLHPRGGRPKGVPNKPKEEHLQST